MSPEERQLLQQILHRLAAVEMFLVHMEKRIMSDVQNLTAAVARLNTSVSNELKAVANALAGNSPDIAAAVTQINGLADQLDTETAALTASGSPAPTPTATPTGTGHDANGSPA